MSITRTIQTNLNTHELRTLLGEYNKHIKYIQERLEVQITQRQDQFIITGELDLVERTEIIINKLVELAGEQHNISGEELHLIIQSSLSRDYDYANTQGKHHDHSGNSKDKSDTNVALRTRKGKIIPRGYNQQEYTKNLDFRCIFWCWASGYRQDLFGGGMCGRYA